MEKNQSELKNTITEINTEKIECRLDDKEEQISSLEHRIVKIKLNSVKKKEF